MHIQSEYRKMERNLRRLMIRVELVKSRRYIIDVYIVITMSSTYVLILCTIIYLYYVSDMCYKLGWWILQVLRSHYRRRSVIEGKIFLVHMYLSSCSICICICILIKFVVIYSMSTLIMTMRIWFYIISYTCIYVYVSMSMYLYRALC